MNTSPNYIPRHTAIRIREALEDTPVVIINGPRQSGKSTLVKHLLHDRPFSYFTFDDATTLNAASKDPQGFIQGLRETVVIDEVQMVPEIFKAIKLTVDQDRRPGRFIITGSADLMALPTISESLTGRMEIITLWPLAQCELRKNEINFPDLIFKDPDSLFKLSGPIFSKDDIIQKLITGGFPEILKRKKESRRTAWFEAYLAGLLQRDIRDLAQIMKLALMPDILSHIAYRMGSTINYSEISRLVSIPNSTLKRYLTYLEHIFLINKVNAWSGNVSKTLVKAPKYMVTDTGLASFLLGIDSSAQLRNSRELGGLMEAFVVMELIKHIGWANEKYRYYHARAHSGMEIDFILQNRRGELAGIEIKSTASVNRHMFKGLFAMKQQISRNFRRGIVLYTGDKIIPFADDMTAIPISFI